MGGLLDKKERINWAMVQQDFDAFAYVSYCIFFNIVSFVKALRSNVNQEIAVFCANLENSVLST